MPPASVSTPCALLVSRPSPRPGLSTTCSCPRAGSCACSAVASAAAANRASTVLLFPAISPTTHLDVRGATVLIVFETDEFHQIRMTIPVGTQQPAGELQRNWFGERSWIFDGEDVFDTAPVRTGPALDRVQLLGMRGATAVEPELVVVTDGVDHQRVTLPVPNRMAPPVIDPVLWMGPPVHVDDAMR